MIRIIFPTTSGLAHNVVCLECDTCGVHLPHNFPSRFNLATVRQGEILRRMATRRDWTCDGSDSFDLCPTCLGEVQ